MSLFLDAMRKSGRGKKQIVDDADTDHYNDADQNTIDQNASHASTQATEYGGEPAPEYRPNQTQEGHQYKGQIIDVDDVLGLSEDAPAKTEFAPAHADSSFSNSESIGNSYTDDPPLDYPLADLAHATPDLLPEPPEPPSQPEPLPEPPPALSEPLAVQSRPRREAGESPETGLHRATQALPEFNSLPESGSTLTSSPPSSHFRSGTNLDHSGGYKTQQHSDHSLETPAPHRHAPTAHPPVQDSGSLRSAVPGDSAQSASRMARFGGLDALFYLIIAVASLLLFASIFLLLTRNNAYIDREYEFLKKQNEGLQARLSASGNPTASVEQADSVVRVQDPTGVTEIASTTVPESRVSADALQPSASETQSIVANDAVTGRAETNPETTGKVDIQSKPPPAVEAEKQYANAKGESIAGEADNMVVLSQAAPEKIDSKDNADTVAPSDVDGRVTALADKNSPIDNSRAAAEYKIEIARLQREMESLRDELQKQGQKVERLQQANQRLRTQSTPALSFGFSANTPAVEWSPRSSGSEGKVIPPLTENESPATVTLTPAAGAETQAQTTLSESPASVAGTDISDLVNRAYISYQKANYAQAASLYSRALEYDPYHRDANLGVAASAQLAGDYRTAEARYRHLLSLDPRDATTFSALLNLSDVLADTAIENEMIIHVERTADPQPLYAALGSYFSQNNRWNDAEWAYKNAVRSAQPEADYLFNLAVVLDNLGNAESASDYYSRALTMTESSGSYTFDREAVISRLRVLESR